MIHVSSLSGLPAVAAKLAAFDLLTLLSPGHVGNQWRALNAHRHLALSFHDIVVPATDLVAPDANTLRDIIAFGRDTPPERGLLIHCWAGISRSSAAAYAIACDRNPGQEWAIAEELRRRAPFVTPNRLMVELADMLLARDGVMVKAMASIGRGAEAFEGTAYVLPACFPLANPTQPSSVRTDRSCGRQQSGSDT